MGPSGPSSGTLVADALNGRVPIGSPVTVKGWIRTRRESKAGGGLCFAPPCTWLVLRFLQVVARAGLSNSRPRSPPYRSFRDATGMLVESKAKWSRPPRSRPRRSGGGLVDEPETYSHRPQQAFLRYLRESPPPAPHQHLRCCGMSALPVVALHRFFDEAAVVLLDPRADHHATC